MTILLWNLLLYAGIGCLEWYLALRRTLACARGEKALLVSLVFAENILGLWVLANFIQSADWLIAIVYSVGAALGALLVSDKQRKAEKEDEDASSDLERRHAQALGAPAAPIEAYSAK
jgi:hypothetical protein